MCYINEYAQKWFPKTFAALKSGKNVYCTENEAEMFAECYTYIMCGSADNTRGEILTKYFSENIELTRQILDEIRNMPDEMRCRTIKEPVKDFFIDYSIIDLLKGKPPGMPS